jgi:hypothetical protein
VNICFPQGVLEEMGVDVVKQHMLENKAPEESISRVTETYGMEMVRCITQMLANYLDTPVKIKSAIKSIIEASSNLHIGVEDDVLDNIATSLSRDDSRQGNVVPNEPTDTVENDHAPTNVTNKRKSKTRDEGNHRVDGMVVDAEESTARTEASQQSSDREDVATKKKISASWRWNIDPDGASAEDLTESLRRPADLFAFHALPIVRGLLEADAKRKEVRRKMQDMLDEMADGEYEKWVESFRKLHNGDEVMLVRIPPETVSIVRTAATPAPIDLQRRMRNANGVPRGTARGKLQPSTVHRSAPRNCAIKRESNAGQSTGGDIRNKADNVVATTTAALRHLSTKGPDVEPKLQTLPIAESQRAQSSELEPKSAFPELLAEDFIFVYLMPVTIIVQDLDLLADMVCSLLRAYSMYYSIQTGASSVIMP